MDRWEGEWEKAFRSMSGREGFVALESSLADDSSCSFLASEPDLVLEGVSDKDWAGLDRELGRRRRTAADTGLPDGAAIGYVTFEGRFRFQFYDSLAIFSHGRAGWVRPPPERLPREVPADPTPRTPLDFRPSLGSEEFVRMVNGAQELIRAGEIYQACLSYDFVAPPARHLARPFYECLRAASPAPYSAFLDAGEIRIASSSPECFLRMSGRTVITRPIKGTRARWRDPEDDERAVHELLTSQKEAAELVMITDLERNDLGQFCDFGTVRVRELLKHERFEHVHHLVSTVTGQLRRGVSHVSALRQMMPGGSISGAPKRRALEAIHELEGRPRGIYTGTIGYFGYNGESEFSIAIRTATFEAHRTTFGVGAGIVADSSPSEEYAETLAKARGLILAAGWMQNATAHDQTLMSRPGSPSGQNSQTESADSERNGPGGFLV